MEYTDFDYLSDSLWLAERGDTEVLAEALRNVFSDFEFLDAIPVGGLWS